MTSWVHMYWPRQAKTCLGAAQNANIQNYTAHAQSHLGFFSTLIQSVVSNDSVNGE